MKLCIFLCETKENKMLSSAFGTNNFFLHRNGSPSSRRKLHLLNITMNETRLPEEPLGYFEKFCSLCFYLHGTRNSNFCSRLRGIKFPMQILFRGRELAYPCLIRKCNHRVIVLICPLQILDFHCH